MSLTVRTHVASSLNAARQRTRHPYRDGRLGALWRIWPVIVTSLLGLGTAPALAEPFAYVANYRDSTVSVIDRGTNAIVATIGVGFEPTHVAVNPLGTRVYVSNTGDHTVSVIDTTSNMVIATIPVGNSPWGLAVTPDGRLVYVASVHLDAVQVIDALSNSVTKTIPVGSDPAEVAMDAAGSRVYVTNHEADTISVISTATDTVIATPTVGGAPNGLAVHPAGTRVYVALNSNASVAVVDAVTNQVLATTHVGGYPVTVAVNPSGTRLYVSDRLPGADTVSVLDTAHAESDPAHAVVATVRVGVSPWGVGVAPDGRLIYVAVSERNTVAVIDALTNDVIAGVPVGNIPSGLDIGPDSASITVAIDIKPGSFPNSVNLDGAGTVPVAILSNAVFDATTVDPTTVTLASAPVKLKGKGTPMASAQDVNGDGFTDLVVHVGTQALQLSETDTEAVLQGKTIHGTFIRGTDSVRVVP